MRKKNPEDASGKKKYKWLKMTMSPGEPHPSSPMAKSAKEIIRGGLADGKKPSDFSKSQLRKGIAVEMEHTNKKSLAREIAMDHLVEDSKYYDKLEKMEKKAAMATPSPAKVKRIIGEFKKKHKINGKPVVMMGSAMYLMGMRPTLRDLDLLITKSPHHHLSSVHSGIDVDSHNTFEINPKLRGYDREVERNAKNIRGMKVQSPKDIIRFKEVLNRPKDRADIKILKRMEKKALLDNNPASQLGKSIGSMFGNKFKPPKPPVPAHMPKNNTTMPGQITNPAKNVGKAVGSLFK